MEEFGRERIAKVSQDLRSEFAKIGEEGIGESLALWWERGIHPGSGVGSILANDLVSTFYWCDQEILAKLGQIVSLIDLYLPTVCWQDPKRIEGWCGAARYYEEQL